MTKKIKVSDLLDPKKFDKHKDDLIKYFGNGGTWQDLLGYSDSVMMAQYKKGYDLYQQAEYKDAAAVFSYLTTLNPYEYQFWLGLGLAKQSDRLYEEALASYTAAEAIEPSNPEVQLQLAQVYYGLEFKDQAIKHLRLCIKVSGAGSEHEAIRKKAQGILRHLSR